MDDVSCDLDQDGTYSILVVDGNGTNTGTYNVSYQKLNQ
jgi:hypothetical protein